MFAVVGGATRKAPKDINLVLFLRYWSALRTNSTVNIDFPGTSLHKPKHLQSFLDNT